MSSCLLQPLVAIRDMEAVKTFLYFDETAPKLDAADEWENDWAEDWSDEKHEDEKTDEGKGGGWIRECKVAVSPNVDYMCVARGGKAVFLTNKSQASGAVSNSFEICWKDIFAQSDREEICSVLCLPLVSLKRSSHGASDWTSVVMGFSSGDVRVYTADSGALVFSQIFHDQPVVELKCATFDRWAHLSHGGAVEQRDELTVLHRDNVLVVLDGFSLFQTMRACRNQLAIASASGSQAAEPPPLACRKWKLQAVADDDVSSHACVPVGELTPFARLHNYSLDHADELQGRVTQYVTVGKSPFVGFYYAAEGNTQPILSHVASAVANKLSKQASALISGVSGWIKWGAATATGAAHNPEPDHYESANKKPPPKIAASTPLKRHSTIPDNIRRGNKIVLAPGKRGLAAVADSLGRVSLIDLNSRSILRMWKGYRDAEIGFVRAHDDTSSSMTSSSHRRHLQATSGVGRKLALFLVIYAPRRGILELWSCVHGPRVGAFNVSKQDRLIFPSHGMLGMNLEKSLGSAPMLQCCLLDSDGCLKDIFIPFHLALSDSKSNKAHDVHLLKKIAQMLHAKNRDGDEILKLLVGMRLCSIQKQALLKFLNTRRIGAEIFHKCISLLCDKYSNGSKKEEKDFVKLLEVKRSLIEIYERITEVNNDFVAQKPFTDWDDLGASLSSELKMKEKDCECAVELTRNYHRASPASTVRFESQMELGLDVAEFLGCFVVEKDDDDSYKISIDESKSAVLGCFLFHSTLFGGGGDSYEGMTKRVLSALSTLATTQQPRLLVIAVQHWHEFEKHTYGNHGRLRELVASLGRRSGGDEEWKGGELLGGVLARSRRPLAAYHTSLVVTSLLTTTEQDGGDDWDTVCVKREKWAALVRQLEDVLSLNTCVMIGNAMSDQGDDKCELVSVEDLLTKGRSHASEVVASLIASASLPPSQLSEDDGNEFVVQLNRCRDERFPFSLSPNSLHVHCFWELMARWHRQVDKVELMGRAVKHLRLVSCQPQVQRGLALMAWHTFIHQRVLALGDLIEKTGKAPKERMCYRDVGISDKRLSEFCGFACDVLQVIADADHDQFPLPNSDNVSASEPGLRCIESNWEEVRGKESIVELARKQADLNYQLVQTNMNFLFVLRATMEFGLKRGVKPYSQLFANVNGRKGLQAQLTNQHVHNSTTPAPRDSANPCRKFIGMIVEACVEKMSVLTTTNEDDEAALRDVREWVESCIQISTEFSLNHMLIHTNYIVLLYSYALDRFGSEELDMVSDAEVAASQLVLTIGQRFNHYLKHVSPEVGVILLAQMNTTVSTWITSQDETQLHKSVSSLDDTLELARKIARILPEQDLPHQLVEALSAAIDA